VNNIGQRGATASNSDSLDFTKFLKIIKSRAILIAVCALVATFAAGEYTFHQPNIYSAQARLDVDLSSTHLLLDSSGSDQISGDNQQKMATQLGILTSQAIAWEVISRLSLYKDPRFGGAPQWADAKEIPDVKKVAIINRFSSGLSVQFERGTEIAAVQYLSTDPELAAAIPNAIADAYISHTYQSKFTATTKESQWLDSQLSEIRKKVAADEKEFADFQKSTGLFLTQDNHSALFDRYSQLNTALEQAQVSRIAKEIAYKQSLEGDTSAGGSIISTPAIEAAKNRLAQFEADYALLSPKFGENYPRIVQTKNEIAQARATISNETKLEKDRIRAEYELALHNEQSLETSVEAEKQKIFGTNENALQYSLLQRQVASGRDLIETLTRQLQVARLTAGLNAQTITVLDPALRPNLPVLPKKRRDVAIGLGGGLFLGLSISFLLESMNQKIRSVGDAEQFSGLPILGVIPPFDRLKADRSKGKGFVALGKQVIDDPRSAYTEAFRRLRSSLLLSSPGNAPKVILVCSAWPKEGKSTVSANLAEVLAQAGKTALLVDADLRRPTLHFTFGIPGNRNGLSRMLTISDSDPLDGVVVPLQDTTSLQFLPAGVIPPSPAELLLSNRMKGVILSWREKFDYVVIDTSPILAVSDAATLGREVDAVLLVVRSGMTTRDSLRSAKNAFIGAGARIAGLVLNGFEADARSGYYYGNDYYGGNANAFDDEGWHE